MEQIFHAQGYVTVKNAVSEEICVLLTKYIRLKAQANPKVLRGSDPLAGVHREYADPLMETILLDLKSTVEQATGLLLYPTLSFCYQYQHGNVLKPHKDRESCEIVAGLCIGADEDFKISQNRWPLRLKDQPEIALGYGDLLIFKGSATEHWREAFSGQWFISAIFAYVDKNGPYAYQKFDQRRQLGTKHVGMLAWTFGRLKARLQARLAKYNG